MINQVLTSADATTIQCVAFVMNEQAFQAFSGLSSENVLFFPSGVDPSSASDQKALRRVSANF